MSRALGRAPPRAAVSSGLSTNAEAPVAGRSRGASVPDASPLPGRSPTAPGQEVSRAARRPRAVRSALREPAAEGGPVSPSRPGEPATGTIQSVLPAPVNRRPRRPSQQLQPRWPGTIQPALPATAAEGGSVSASRPGEPAAGSVQAALRESSAKGGPVSACGPGEPEAGAVQPAPPALIGGGSAPPGGDHRARCGRQPAPRVGRG